MTRGGGRAGRTCCWCGRSNWPGRQTSTRTWDCPASPSRSGSSLVASSTETWGWDDSSCVSCTCAANNIE